jgi:hypothetical protein
MLCFLTDSAYFGFREGFFFLAENKLIWKGLNGTPPIFEESRIFGDID